MGFEPTVIYRGKIPHKRCLICGHFFRTKKSHLSRRKTCSRECSSLHKKNMYLGKGNPNYGNREERNPIYKGGFISNYGYKMIRKPDHPNAGMGGYIFEHRYVMSKHLGRPLTEDEVVHHKDENRLNNDITNLEIMSRSEHNQHHMKDYEIVRDAKGRIRTIKRITPLPQVEAIGIDSLEESDRGEGGFGSTGV